MQNCHGFLSWSDKYLGSYAESLVTPRLPGARATTTSITSYSYQRDSISAGHVVLAGDRCLLCHGGKLDPWQVCITSSSQKRDSTSEGVKLQVTLSLQVIGVSSVTSS